MSEAADFASRAGAKLAHALDAFELDVTGMRCADFGCNIGGFTDCLLQNGASNVIAIDTGYGVLDWKLRNDDRVEVQERTNVLHAEPPAGGVDLVVIDVGWTPQSRSIPSAMNWLVPGGRIITLVKPHYELDKERKREHLLEGRLDEAVAETILQEVIDSIPSMGAHVLGHVRSPLRGGKSGRGGGRGNVEFLVHLAPGTGA